MAHIPANRIGNTVLTLPQLQVLQIGMSLLFFIPFATLVLKRHIGLNYIWAAACLVGAAFFIFREGGHPAPEKPGLAQVEGVPLVSSKGLGESPLKLDSDIDKKRTVSYFKGE